MEVVATTGKIRRAKLQSNHHRQQTNVQLFTGQMPFLSPNQQCQIKELKGIISHSMDLLTLSSPGGLTTLSLITGILASEGWWEACNPPQGNQELLVVKHVPVPAVKKCTPNPQIVRY